MSEWNRTAREYIQRYAERYCGGDVEKAKTHKMVREVICFKCTNDACKKHASSILKRQKIRDCTDKATEGRTDEKHD